MGPQDTRAGWRRSPAGPRRRAERLHGARWAAFVRPVADGGRLGWGRRQPGDRGLSSELGRRWPCYLPLAPPASPSPPPAAAAAAFYFDSTLRGRERRRGAGGCPELCAPVSLVQPPGGRPRAGGHSRRNTLLAHTPDYSRPRRGAQMSTPALKGVCSESPGRLFLETLPGDPHKPWPQALTHVHSLLLLFSNLLPIVLTHTYICAQALVHTAVAV